MYQQAVTRLIRAAGQVAEYRDDLAGFADTLAGKRWGTEVTGPIQDMDAQLAAVEGIYRDLATQMKHQGDAGAAAYDQAPWVPGSLLATEYRPSFTIGSPAMVTTPQFEPPKQDDLEDGPYSLHKRPPSEDRNIRLLVGLIFDPSPPYKPLASRLIQQLLDRAPDTDRDAWLRRADEVARAWGRGLYRPGGLLDDLDATGGSDGSGAAPEPTPSVATEPGPVVEPVSGRLSDTPLAENGWGQDPSKPVNYHDDGPIGTAIRHMGQDAQMDVDGEPLANVMGTVATDVVFGRRTAQQAIEDLTALRDRLPESSQARKRLAGAINQMDAPASPEPTLPDGTLEPLRNLVRALHAVPMVRSKPNKEMQPLLDIIADFAAGRASGRRMIEDIRNLRNRRHESYGEAGKFEIDRAVDAAVKELGELPREELTPPGQR